MENEYEVLKQLNIEDNNPELVSKKYKKIIEEAKGKTYLELLPNNLPKNGLITKYIHYYIDSMYEHFQSDIIKKLYPNGVSKEEITMYLLTKPVEQNLKREIIPNIPNPYCLPKDKELLEWVEDFSHFRTLDLLDDYNNSVKYSDCRKNYKPLEIEENGFPRGGRLNMCVSFIPVKNLPIVYNLLKDNLNCKLSLIKPKSKKEVLFDIIDISEEGFYKVKDDKDRIVFLADYEYIKDSYDDLFQINKAIVGNWWSRTLEYIG